MCLFGLVLWIDTAWSYLSGHQRPNVRLSSPLKAESPVNKGKEWRLWQGIYSFAYTFLTYSVFTDGPAGFTHCPPPTRPPPLHFSVAAENYHWKICTSVVNNNQLFHVLGSSGFTRVFMYLYWSWSVNLWIPVLKRGEIRCWSFRVTACTPSPQAESQ